MYHSLQLSGYVRTKLSTVNSPYIHDAAVPATYLGFVQIKVSQSFLIGLKGLGDRLGQFFQAIGLY
jgi:hypothetical protein